MKYIFSVVLFIFLPLSGIFATETDTTTDSIPTKKHRRMTYSGYQGGMMLHMGYAQSRNFQLNNLSGAPIGSSCQLKGMVLGIGGAIRIGFGKHLRVGTEGYFSTHNYGPNASFAKIGWGGLLLDSHWKIKKVTLFVGGVIGGGSYTHLTLIDKDPKNPAGDYKEDFVIENQNASYRHYPFLAIDPFIGIEYAITKRIGLVAKIDYLLNATNWTDDFATGPRFFIGFMFGR